MGYPKPQLKQWACTLHIIDSILSSFHNLWGGDKVRKNISANSDSELLTAKVGSIKQQDNEAWTNVKYVRLLLFLVSLYYLF